MITVPSFVGLSPAKASDSVIGLLQIRWGGTMSADAHKNGKIASHNPPAGAKVKKMSEVQIILQQVALPNVMKLSLDEALQKLRAAGLDGKVVGGCLSSTEAEGKICATFLDLLRIEAGYRVDMGRVISLHQYRRK
jgi:beta-lactam-binding protein with PASTA domain